MQIHIRDTDPAVIDAIRAYLGNGHSQISLMVGSVIELEVSAVVSPANSFGFMDGGINRAYLDFFGRDVEARLQDRISHRLVGELLVGEALLVETAHPKIPLMICAPMVRASTAVEDPVDIMLACRAAVLLARKEHLTSIAFPGMGTGYGEAPLGLAARSMVAGIYKGIAGRAPFPARREDVAQEQTHLRGE